MNGQDGTKERDKYYRDWLNRSITRAIMRNDSTSSSSTFCSDVPVYGSNVGLSEWCDRVNVAESSIMCINVELVEEVDPNRKEKNISIPAFHGLGMTNLLLIVYLSYAL
jgi:hypothetical protein